MFVSVALLTALNAWILATTKLPPNLIEVKRRYRELREHLRHTDRFPSLWIEKPITGFHRRGDTNVGYNSNKGDDIAVCVDGNVNSVMHVLLHELAHCTVDEFDHTDEFWRNYKELRDVAASIGVYEVISQETEFCGKSIGDPSSTLTRSLSTRGRTVSHN